MFGICQNGRCVNTVGSFACDCNLGYVYDEDSRQCIDRNECGLLATNVACRGNSRCVNTPGSFECVCPPGYRLDHSGRNCRDIDECAGKNERRYQSVLQRFSFTSSP